VEVAEKGRSSEQGSANRLTGSNCSHVARRSPLIRGCGPTLILPQNLQGGLRSGIALLHYLSSLGPEGS
jgi:hypothetical protein